MLAADPSPAQTCIADHAIAIGGGRIDIEFKASEFAIGTAPLCAWIAKAAGAVTTYFGHYPVKSVRLVVEATADAGVQGGTTYNAVDGRPLIRIPLGRDTTQAQLDQDWVMTHEMVHLAVPLVPRNSHWLEEGIATYVEPIARIEAGQLDATGVWADMFHGMPKGLPAAGDRGLDRTPTWGRTYWGGALFCLLADVEIRRRTDNRMGLRDALRGVLAAGGNAGEDWPVARILAAGDRTVGVPVLTGLYEQMGDAPGPKELDSLWQRLGIVADGDGVRFVADAPLAAVREAITSTTPDSPR